MTQPYIDLMEAAIKKHGKDIQMIGTQNLLSECFMLYSNKLMFHYDTPDHNSHCTVMNLETGEIK